MTTYRHGRRQVGSWATKTRVVEIDGHRSIVVDESEPIFMDCHGDCDLDREGCVCDEKGCCQ